MISGSSRGLRGGSWNNGESFLRASDRISVGPTFESSGVGFRVASVPESSGLVLTVLASGLMLVRRKR